MLDTLRLYCAKWRIFVNVAKTKVIVFNHTVNRSTWSKTCPIFLYNNEVVEVVEEFKYLGVYFHARNKETCCIQHRLAQAKRLVAAWMRRCQMWCFKPDVVVRQFNTCVLPALEYGIGVWGCGNYKSTAWKEVETFWRYIARCILGISVRAPNGGVYGDLGWTPFWVRAAHQATTMWTRITEMSSSTIVRKAMYVQREMLLNGDDCWLKKFKDTLLCTRTCGVDMWTTWLNDNDFRVTCSRNEEYIDGIYRAVRWETDCLNAIHEVARNEWYMDVTRIEAKRGEGRNKLRTYALFKSEWGFEPYLVSVNSYERRVLLSKFRLGICPLRIETGRYEVITRNSKGRPEAERLCLQCMLGKVEDEFHFLLQCPVYANRRASFLHVIQDKLSISSEVMQAACIDKNNVFGDIMRSVDDDVINAVADYIWDAFVIRERLVLNGVNSQLIYVAE